MSVQIFDNYISGEQAKIIIDGLSPYLVKSDRIGMSEAQYEDPTKALFNIYDGKPIIDNEESLDAATLFTEIVNDVAKEISKFYNVEAVVASSIFAEVAEGGFNGLHCDSVMLDGTPWDDNNEALDNLEFSALVYLNTSGVDYEGGQIEFPNQKIRVTPEAGKMVFFRGDIDHPHEVFEVTAGKRYTLVLFYGRASEVKQYQRFLSERDFGGI
jgi:predicted 2-oxoglutarate/Fe(II)-dependent dioxygenase YbiX